MLFFYACCVLIGCSAFGCLALISPQAGCLLFTFRVSRGVWSGYSDTVASKKTLWIRWAIVCCVGVCGLLGKQMCLQFFFPKQLQRWRTKAIQFSKVLIFFYFQRTKLVYNYFYKLQLVDLCDCKCWQYKLSQHFLTGTIINKTDTASHH